MNLHPGYEQQGEHGVTLVCKLNKSIYGLKQASQQWNKKLSSFIISRGFVELKSDYSFFNKKISCSYTILLIYVDEIIIDGMI